MVTSTRPTATDPLALFSAPVRAWFESTFAAPTKAQAEGWKIFKTDLPGPSGAVTYFAIVDPVIKGNDYNMRQILTEAFGVADTNTIYKTLADSRPQEYLLVNTFSVISLSPCVGKR